MKSLQYFSHNSVHKQTDSGKTLPVWWK